MAQRWQKSGPNHVPAYQMSGIPFVTSSATTEVPRVDNAAAHPVEIKFPFVTKNIKIRNIGSSDLRIAFSYSGSLTPGQAPKDSSLTSNYFLLPTAAAGKIDTQDFDVRCTKVFFAGSGGTTGFSIFAGLTTIPANQFPELTGSVAGATHFEGIG